MSVEEEDYTKIILDRQKPMLRFSVFKERYLPLLFSEDPSLFNNRWIEDVSISPYLEVDLIDEHGKLVYTVPPLRRQVNSHANTVLNEMTKMAVIEASIHSEMGNIFLENNLPKLVKFDDSRSPEIQERWKTFLTELGYGEFLADGKQISREINSGGGLEIVDNEDW